MNTLIFRASLGLAALAMAGPVVAADGETAGPALPDWLSLHGQFTTVAQYHPAFTSPFEGANSLDGRGQTRETIDATMFLGVQPFPGFELYANPEIDQGFGLSDTLGLAGFSSGEAYKVGKADPYVRLQRAFARYTMDLGGDLGGDAVAIDDGANQVAGHHSADTVVITAGKFSAADIFDTNAYAHDPRADFLNWAVIDSGAYDYAADAWGYTYGATAEWTQAWWTLRAGAFDLSKVPNSIVLDTGFQQFELVAEAEGRHDLFGQPGKVKLLGFINRGRMGRYDDAVTLGQQTGATPDIGLVRRYLSRPGAALNIEQGLTTDLGAFVRLSANDGSKEAFEFTEINRSAAAGLAVKGALWGRGNDTFGLAAVVNGISPAARAYFAAGGLGILIGDGQLPRYGSEKIIETYYKVTIFDGIALSLDYQHVASPAYDAARGPVDILGVRFHAEF